MNDSIFTKIIRGEIPSHKIYEDEKTFAFLDINPKQPGHVLVIPKAQVDKVYDLDDENYCALWKSVKKIAKHMEQILGRRIGFNVVGIDVPHAHVHLIPFDSIDDLKAEKQSPSQEELAAMAEKLRLN
jgi:histidine triad (HIT) family protein